MIGLLMPPPTAPLAFRTLAWSFPGMMKRVGIDVEIITGHDGLGLHRSAPKEYEIVLYTWVPPLVPPRARRHIEIIVDGDLPPTGDQERVFPSEAWRNFMWGHYRSTRPQTIGHVIPNWVDPELWPISFEVDDYFLYVGRLQPLKLGLLPELVKAFPERTFKIVGTGNAALIPSSLNVEMLGQVEQPELSRLMGRARAVLCPSQYCEPFGLAAVEAGLTGALVIASDVGGFHETVPPASMLVDPFDLRAWVRALHNAADASAESHTRLLRRGWHDSTHSPATIGRRYRDLLERPAPEVISLNQGAFACG